MGLLASIVIKINNNNNSIAFIANTLMHWWRKIVVTGVGGTMERQRLHHKMSMENYWGWIIARGGSTCPLGAPWFLHLCHAWIMAVLLGLCCHACGQAITPDYCDIIGICLMLIIGILWKLDDGNLMERL